ncbi:MAG: hypothetical protein Alpg2KO_10810 [Alphaproteobacteria bacterium]
MAAIGRHRLTRDGAGQVITTGSARFPRGQMAPIVDRWTSFWYAGSFAAYDTLLLSDHVALRPPRPSDYAEWLALRQDSRTHLTPWEPTWLEGEMTPRGFKRRIEIEYQDIRHDLTWPFFIFRRDTGELAGGINLRHIRRGVAQTATLGYWMGAAHAGHGLMRAALNRVIAHAFVAQGLRRLEAGILPENEPSRRLLEGAGFQPEGIARHWLRINGKLRDHQMYALLNPQQNS